MPIRRHASRQGWYRVRVGQVVVRILDQDTFLVDRVVRDASIGVCITDDPLIVKDRSVRSVHIAEIVRCSVVEAVEFIPAIERHHFFGIAVVCLTKQPARVTDTSV